LPASADQEIRLLRTSFWSARDPSGRAFAPLAEAFRQEGDLDEAEALLAEGLSRHPNFTTALLVAARVARDRGNLILAREQLDRLLHLDGGNVLALRDRAEARLAEGDREGALEDLREASRLEPGNDEFRRRIESVGVAPAPALPHVEEPEAEPDFVDRPILTRTMGDIYARQGFLARALEVYEHLHAENPDDQELQARLDELRGGGDGGRGASVEPEVDADSGGRPDAAIEPAPRTPVHGMRTIAGYFEDLLAWVPGAVPIASLAPGSSGGGAGASPDSGSDGEDGPGNPKEGNDDFNRWLEGLGR
jgi:tetratricopeptide (TPR) repeat protein